MKTLPRSRSSCGVAYHARGVGTPIVFLHGVGLCAEVWLPQIEVFSSDYRVYVPDLPGHGESSRFTDETPMLAHYSDRIAQFLVETVDHPVVIVGHSLGALISLDLATRYPSLCQGIAALAPIYRRSSTAQAAVLKRARELSLKSSGNAAEAPVRRWFGDTPGGRDLELAQLCRSWLRQVNRQGYVQAYSAFAHSSGPDEQALASVHMPALFLSAELDQNSTPEMAQSLAARVAGSNAVLVRNARHMVPLSHPDEVNIALTQLFERCKNHPESGRASSGETNHE